MTGVGYRREMADWEMSAVAADFFEVAPENWLRRDRTPLVRLLDSQRPLHLHGVSLNLGGTAALDVSFIREVGAFMEELSLACYSDHLAASGDAHQLYDLFPVPFTEDEVLRVSDRIKAVQDLLGRRIAIENPTWYTNIGDLPEPEFLSRVLVQADCQLLLDLNNLEVNFKNHGGLAPAAFVRELEWSRISYLHVAGHEFDDRFGMHLDTHSQPPSSSTVALARELQQQHGVAVLLEWDNDLPTLEILNGALACLRISTPT